MFVVSTCCKKVMKKMFFFYLHANVSIAKLFDGTTTDE